MEPFPKVVYVVGTIFCITPWYNFKSYKMKKTYVNQLCVVIMGLFFGSTVALGSYLRSLSYHEYSYDKFLLIFNCLLTILIMGYVMISSAFNKRSHWEIFLKKLLNLDVLSLDPKKNSSTSIFFFYFQFVSGHIFFIMIFLLSGCNWFLIYGGWSILVTSSAMLSEYYCYLYSMVTSRLALVINSAYESLNRTIEVIIKKNLAQTVQNRCDEESVKSIIIIAKNYRKISEVVYYYNSVFGLSTFLIICHTVVQILRLSNLALRIMDEKSFPWGMLASVLLGCLGSWMESSYIIMCCERTSATGTRMKELCYRLQEDLNAECKTRKELFKLADIVETFKPKFTAANFFVINQGTILGIVNIATTYLIVVIQFYNTVHEKHL